jgi:hypothetical protein
MQNVAKRTSRPKYLVAALSMTFLVSLVLLALGRESDRAREKKTNGDASNSGLAHKYRQSLLGPPTAGPPLERIGPDADQSVQFQPEGLRITLPPGYTGPPGWNKERPDTGIVIPLAVKGDFEITVKFEILKEPDRVDAGYPQTRLTLDVSVDRESHVEATISRRVSRWSGTEFLAWARQKEDGHDRSKFKEFSTRAKSGRLRLVRTGSIVSYYAAEGPDDLYTLLQQFPFSPNSLENIRIVASTGGPKAALDVRFTDLHVRAESLNIVSDPPILPVQGKGSSLVVFAGVFMSIVVLGTFLAVWRHRHARALAASVAPVESEEAAPDTTRFSFPCSYCGRKLKAGAALSGKKVKCPACGNCVQVAAFS